MQSENSINEPEQQDNSFIRRIITGGIIAAAAAAILGALYYFFLISDPPPIIVKTGSLIFQSSKQIKQTVLGRYTYTVGNFGVDFKGVKIKNLSQTVPDMDYDNKNGALELDVSLQKLEGDTWVDFDTLIFRAVGAGNQKDFTIQTKIDLEQQNTSLPKYPYIWEDSGTFRVKEIIVRKKGVPETPSIDIGNHYAICLYNTLPMDKEYCK